MDEAVLGLQFVQVTCFNTSRKHFACDNNQHQQHKQLKENSMAAKKKPAFGGYTISFKGCDESVEKVFGSTPIAPSEMTKKIWAYVKKNKLANK